MTTVLLLAGGPDAEREVSLKSAAGIAGGLSVAGYAVNQRVIDRITQAELGAMPGDVIFPALHGKYGEGGPLQAMLEADGRPFVASGFRAARACMDKVLTKSIAREVGMLCAPTMILDPADDGLPLDLPVVVKPIFEGSTIGLYVCRTPEDWKRAHSASAASGKPCMVEPFVPGKELTLGLIPAFSRDGSGTPRVRGGGQLTPLPLIHITPAEGLYDFEAKYTRNDTHYIVGPSLPKGTIDRFSEQTLALASAIGVRHLCRADFILDDLNRAWFLELNTLPGFTDHSLVPMAAATVGLPMPELCSLLVEAALSDAGVKHSH